jgi:hypothetical protein
VKEEETGSGNSSTDNINSWSGPDYQIYIPLMGPLVRVMYSGLTQSVFRLDRVKSSSCDCSARIFVDSNSSCFTSFNSGSIAPKVAEFRPIFTIRSVIVCCLRCFS